MMGSFVRVAGCVIVVCGVFGAYPGGVCAQSSSPSERVDAVPERGDEVVVVFRDGRRMGGEFVSNDGKRLVVVVSGVEVELATTSYKELLVLEPARVRYQRMRVLVENDPRKMMNLAEWCRRRGMFAEALAEVDRVLAQDPYFEGAAQLQTLVVQEAALQRVQGTGNDPEPEQEEHAEEFARRPLPGAFSLLTEEQVNLIKVFEIDLSDPPKMVIDRKVVEELLRRYSDSVYIPSTREGREEILRWAPEKVLALMFQVRARDLYGEVRVIGQPKSMKRFRDHVHARWLMNNAATTKCHGGTGAGGLQLTNRKPRSDASVYTNFLILDRYRMGSGESLIDYDDAANSVLLQMGLPRDDSAFPHPEVRGWRAVFRSRDARGYQQAVEWIESMYRPRPDYPIEYEAPGGSGGLGEDVDR
jgi:hypothetical protein